MDTINTFENGMHQDNDFSQQPKGSYYKSINGEVFNVYGKNFSWMPAKGTEEVPLPTGFTPIGGIKVKNGLILHLKDTTNNVDLIINLYVLGTTYTYSNVYASKVLNYSIANLINGYSYYENQDTEFIYWTDRKNKPRAINVLGISLVTPSSSSVGMTFLVLAGEATYDSVVYSIGEYFTLWNYALLSTTTTTQLIEYFEPEILNWNPEILNQEVKEYSEISGALEPGVYYITHRYITFQNHVTPWSPLSRPLSILNVNGGLTYEYADYGFVKDWNQYQGGDLNVNTQKGISVVISKIPVSNYKYIEIAAYRSVGADIVDNGVIFSKIELTNVATATDDLTETVTATLFNYNGIGITQAEFTIQSTSISKIQDLETINQRNVIINITEEEDINMDQKWMPRPINGIKTCTHEVPLDIMPAVDSETDNPITGIYGFDEDGYISQGHILTGQYYKVFENTLTYNSITHNIGDVFLGLETVEWTGLGKLKPVTRICKYVDNTNTAIFEYHEHGSSNGPKGLDAKYSAGYWGGETYRLGVLPVSLTGKFLPVRWLDDYTVPERLKTERVTKFNESGTLIDTGNELIGRHTRNDSLGLVPGQLEQTNGVYDSLLVSIELTDIIDDISGFHIVRAERTNGVLSEGLIDNIIEVEWEDNRTAGDDKIKKEFTRYAYFNNLRKYHIYESVDDGYLPFNWLNKGMNTKSYIYASPELLFTDVKNINVSDTFKLKHVYFSFNSDYNKTTTVVPIRIYNYRITKFLDEITDSNHDTIATGLNSYVNLEIGDKDVEVYGNTSLLQNYSPNFTVLTSLGNIIENDINDAGGSGTLLNLKNIKEWYDRSMFYNPGTPSHYSAEQLFVVEQKRGSSNYGGQSNDSLKNTEYILTGHYQPISAEFKAAIKYGNQYIAYNMQIFGGDCHVNLFEYQRLLMNGTLLATSIALGYYNERHSDCIVVPLQSKYNLSLRHGKFSSNLNHGIFNQRVAFNPYYYKPEDVDSVYTDGNSSLYENYDFNSAFLTGINEFKFPALSPFSSSVNHFDNRLRYSLKKSIGELIDNFTEFPALNYIDIPGNNGSLVNIKTKGSRLFFWQTNGLGYYPVSERALSANDLGLPIQLGIGSEFERSDELNKVFGNQDFFSLIETDSNWMWFDFTRKTLLSMSFNGQLTEESVIKGIDTFLQNEITERKFFAVYGGYDPKTKIAYFTFMNLYNLMLDYPTISVNTKSNKVTGFHQFPAYLYLSYLNEFFSVNQINHIMYKHNIQNSTTLHGEAFESAIEMIIGNENDELKRFINLIFKSGRNFFDQVEYSTMYDDDTNAFLNVVSEAVGRDYDFIVDEWKTGIPEGTLGRMMGLYMKLKLTVTDQTKLVRLNKIITHYLKQH